MIMRSKRLEPYVEKMVWQGSATNEPFMVYPDRFHVMGIQSLGHVMNISEEGAIPLDCAGLTGIHHKPKMFQTSLSCSSVLIYFKPEALSFWPLCRPGEIAGKSVGLSDLWKFEESRFREDIRLQNDPTFFLNVIENMLWKQFKNIEIDPWAKWAADQIIFSRGSIRVAHMADMAVLSKRQFERRFVEQIGISPKSFSEIVKFRHVLHSIDSNKSLTEIAHEAKYFDQSHLIKNFRKMSGTSPRRLRQKILSERI